MVAKKYLFDLSGNEDEAKKANVRKLLKTVSDLGFDDTETSTETNKLISRINKDFSKATAKKLTQLTVEFDFSTIVPNLYARKSNKDIYLDIDATDLSEDSNNLFEYLFELIKKKKIIFLNITLMNYFYTKKGKDESVHSVAAILFPKKDGSYRFYYINSHGKDVRDYNEYCINQKGKKKKETLTLKNSYEILFIRDFLKCLRAYLKNNYLKRNIHFDDTRTYLYSGANLQAGDDHGVCFLFTLLVYYYLGVFMNKTRKVTDTIDIKGKTKIEIPKSKDMIEGGNLTDFVYYSVMDYDDSLKKLILFRNKYVGMKSKPKLDLGYETDVNEGKTYKDKLECVLEESDTIFINRIITALLNYRSSFV
jgi:hypothetical protein